MTKVDESKLRKKDTRVFQRTYSVLVENEPGVLVRIAGLFSARGFNILSLTVGETMDKSMSRMTIVVEGTPTVLEQVNKQLNKLIPVISVLPIPDQEMVVEELILTKLKRKDGIRELVEREAATGKSIAVVEEGSEFVLLRIVASRKQEEAIFELLKDFEIVEICRTGEAALHKTKTFGFLEKK